MKKAYIFPGQGSQRKGMGKDLFVKFKKEVEIANRILGYDIVDLCVNDPQNLLGQTQYTQPALFVVNALAFFDKRDKGETADYFAGHSLGEYNALLAAGCFDFETGLKLVKKRGELIAEAKDGGMAAIVGLDSDTIINSLKNGGVTTIDLANYNTPSQIVISGPKNDIAKAIEILNKAGAKLCAPLNVSGAFHSRYMKPSADSFALFLKEFKFNDPLKPVISNRNARPYEKGEVIENLSLQINHSVLWTDSIRYLMGKDVSIYEELGNGNVLSGLVTKIQKEAEPIYVVDSVSKKDPEVKKLLAPEDLGSKAFKTDYGIKFAYYAGAMYRGTASKELVVRMAKAGHLAFLGTGGMDLAWMEKDIKFIQEQLAPHQVFGANLLCNLQDPVVEENSVALFIKYKIKCLEASAFMDVTPALVWYRLQGLKEDSNGKIELHNKIIVKLSRPEVAEFFLTPPSPKIVAGLVASGKISKRVGELAEKISMIDDICVEADSGGHTDAGHTAILLPAIIRLRDEACKKFNYSKKIRVGTGGGIGTPEAAAAAFILGADFIVTGSINQCTVEAGTSDVVKDLLNQANVQDTTYAPAGDMFEVGARVQVLKKGLFFAARANKLYEVYKNFDSLEQIDEKTSQQIQEKYFKKSFDEIWKETIEYFKVKDPSQIEKAEKNPKFKMSLVFRWYFGLSTRMAFAGDLSRKVDFQIHTGPAIGAFNQWVKGTELEHWKNRHVDEIATLMMNETAKLLTERINELFA